MSDREPFLYADVHGSHEDHFTYFDGDPDDRPSLVVQQAGRLSVHQPSQHTFGELNEATAQLQERAIQNNMEFVVACEADVVDVTHKMAFRLMDYEFEQKRAAIKHGREYVPPAFVSLMNGANPWVATLGRELNKLGYEHYLGPFEPVSINLSRYGESQDASLKVEVKKPLTEEDAKAIDGRRLYLVDDLVDEGYTLEATKLYMRNRMQELGLQTPPQMRTAVLGNKNVEIVEPDIWGMELPVVWIVGWGCDSAGNYRFSDLIGVSAYQKPEKEDDLRALIAKRERRMNGDPDAQAAPPGSLINVDFTLVDSQGNVLNGAK